MHFLYLERRPNCFVRNYFINKNNICLTLLKLDLLLDIGLLCILECKEPKIANQEKELKARLEKESVAFLLRSFRYI